VHPALAANVNPAPTPLLSVNLQTDQLNWAGKTFKIFETFNLYLVG